MQQVQDVQLKSVSETHFCPMRRTYIAYETKRLEPKISPTYAPDITKESCCIACVLGMTKSYSNALLQNPQGVQVGSDH